MLCKLNSCARCGGDFVLDGDTWRCWQCGRYLYPRLDRQLLFEEPDPEVTETMTEGMPTHRHRRPRWAVENINVLIEARNRNVERWWIRNKDIVQYLDEGRPIREISPLVGRSERQIRVIKEQLYDLRTAQGQG
mgnify:CR=1 FL=1